MNSSKLMRQQLDASLHRFSPLRNASPPAKGWIQAIRKALGMSARQLAARLGIRQQAITRIEQAEKEGAVTLKTLRRVAESMDCILVYGFVPKSSLEETLRQRVREHAAVRLSRAARSMALEDQSLSSTENREVLDDMVGEIIRRPPAQLWDIDERV